MALEETKKVLQRLQDKYRKDLNPVVSDLKYWGPEGHYRDIEKRDAEYIYQAISDLREHVRNSESPITFDIEEVFITEKKALEALRKLSDDLEKEIQILSQLNKKYISKGYKKFWAIVATLKYHKEVREAIGEVLNSEEVKKFFASRGHSAHKGIVSRVSSDEWSNTSKKSRLNKSLLGSSEHPCSFKLKDEYNLEETIGNLHDYLNKNGYISATVIQFSKLFSNKSVRKKIKWHKKNYELKFFIMALKSHLNNADDRWDVAFNCFLDENGDEFKHKGQIEKARHTKKFKPDSKPFSNMAIHFVKKKAR